MAGTDETLTPVNCVSNVYDQTTGVEKVLPRLVGVADTKGWQIGSKIHLYWMPVIIPLGWVGNIMSLVVLLKPKNRAFSCCLYMAGLAVCDCGMLAIALEYYIRSIQILYFWNADMNTVVLPSTECKVMTWMFQVFSLSGVYIIICMTADRLIGVKFPLHAKSLCTRSRAKKTLFFIPVCTAAYTFPYFVYSKYQGPTCVALAVQSKAATIYSWVTICLNCFIPFFCILSMNAVIIITIVHQKKKPEIHNITMKKPGQESTPDTPQKTNTSKSRESQLVFMLLMISFSFLAFTLPLYIRYILYQYLDQGTTLEAASTFQLVFHITNKMFYTNNAINFLLYCIGGSKFRKDLEKTVCCCRRHGQEQDISSRPSVSGNSMTISAQL